MTSPLSNAHSIAALLPLLRERQTFLISSHARPDGDAIGSALGMMHLLEALGKHVVVAFADPIPPQFSCLQGVGRIVHTLPAVVPDAAILLECDSVQRTGFAAIPARFTINIDHHLSGREYAGFNWIDPQACAVGAMVYDLAVAAQVPVSTAMADCLYAAILTDTGSFCFSATDAHTFAIAEQLVRCGTNPNRIAQCMYFSVPPSKLRLLGAAIANMHIQGKVCWSSISTADMDRAGASAEDTEGVVNHLIAVAGIEAAVLLRQQPDPAEYRLSLRSKDVVDVARVAEHFGGGGHRSASGCNIQGTVASVVDRVLAEIERQLQPSPEAVPLEPRPAAPQLVPATPSTLVA